MQVSDLVYDLVSNHIPAVVPGLLVFFFFPPKGGDQRREKEKRGGDK